MPSSTVLPVAVESCQNGCGWWLDEGERQVLAAAQEPPTRLRLRKTARTDEDYRLAIARRFAVERAPPSRAEPEPELFLSPWELDGIQRLVAWMGLPVESGRFFDRRAWMTLVLILLNVAVLAVTLFHHADNWFWILLGEVPGDILGVCALWPARLFGDPAGHWHGLITCMFLHGGLAHLAGNMLFLFMAGDDVELRLGAPGFLVFYLLGGLAASATSLAAGLHSEVAHLGASGAISAVMGAYLVMASGKRIYLWGVRFLLWGRLVGFPAWLYMVIWFGVQVALTRVPGLRVDVWAHIGGFVFGFLVARMATSRPRRAAGAG